MELAKIIIYFKNRSPIKLLFDTILWKSLYKKKSDLFNLRIIRSFVYYHNIETEINLNRQTKLDPRTRQTRLIRYGKRSNQYRIWNSTNNKIEEISFIRINESDYMIILKKLKKQKMTLSLLNESKDPSSNNKIIEISILPINFNKDKYKSLSIFIHYCPNLLTLTKINESDINKKFINFK
jgi:hypothetical protein